MIPLTAPDGSQVCIDGARVARLRGTYPNESEPRAASRIDWVGIAFVTEAPDAVAASVMQEHAHIAQLSLPGGAPVWLDAMSASGPVRIVLHEKVDGVQSAVMLGGRKQYLSNTHQQVSDAIAAAGGTPLPIPAEAGMLGDWMGRLRNMVAPEAVWE